jgi:hypothetical protein
MLDVVLAGGLVVAVAGVVEAAASRSRRQWSGVALLRQTIEHLDGADAETLRAELRRSGLTLPERAQPRGFI